MPFLVAAVVLVSAICLINLLLTYGVIRRLRQHAALLSPEGGDDSMAAVGSTVGEFAATATDGTVITSTSFTGPTLVGFFSPGCPPCDTLLPTFVASAAAGIDADGRDVRHALAVVTDGRDVQAFLSRLPSSVPVIGGGEAQRVAAAFGVRGYPCVCVVDAGGVITAVGTRLVSASRRVPA